MSRTWGTAEGLSRGRGAFGVAFAGVHFAIVEPVLTFAGTWTLEPVPAALMIGSWLLYLAGVATLRRREQSWSRWRAASFLAGLVLTGLVIFGPIGAYDDTFFWAHMVQHMVVMLIAGPLLLLGSPVLLLLQTSPRWVRHDYLVPVLRSRIVIRLSNPVTGWLIFAGVLLGTHFSPFYNFALQHRPVHDYIEHPLYFGAALIYYYPLIGHNAVPRSVKPGFRVASLVTIMLPMTMTGFFIYSANYLLYPHYAHVDRPFGPGAFADQQLAGALMWAGSMIIGSVWVVMAVLDWLHTEELRARRLDLQTLAPPVRPVGA